MRLASGLLTSLAAAVLLALGPVALAAEVAPAQQAESIRQLRDGIEHRYSYRDVHVVDWPAAWAAYEPRLATAKTSREFAVLAGEMLAATNDPHIWLTEGGEIVPAFRRRVPPNANSKLLPALIAGWKQPHTMVAAGRAADGIGYLAIHSWERKHAPQLLDAALAALREMRDLPALIIDVRLNSGGDEAIARAFAGCFVRERALYARHVTLDPKSPGGFTAPFARWLEPNATGPAYAGRVAVLMGRSNMSSCEAFLLMMKQAPKCTLIGERSFGASGNPQPLALANGVTVLLPSWKAMRPDGTVFEGKGLAPDITVTATAEEFAQRDPVLARAIEFLRN